MRSFSDSSRPRAERSPARKPAWRCRQPRIEPCRRIFQILHWGFSRACARRGDEGGVLNYLKDLSLPSLSASTADSTPRILQARVGTFIERFRLPARSSRRRSGRGRGAAEAIRYFPANRRSRGPREQQPVQTDFLSLSCPVVPPASPTGDDVGPCRDRATGLATPTPDTPLRHTGERGPTRRKRRPLPARACGFPGSSTIARRLIANEGRQSPHH